jgi:hypothetical protein
VDLENHTINVGNAKYAAKYQKLLDNIAIHIQHKYKVGANAAKAIRDLVLPIVTLPTYPVGASGNPPNAGELYLWHQSITKANKYKLFIKENKKIVYALVFGQSAFPS